MRRFALIRHPPVRVEPGVCYGRRDLPLADTADIAAVVARLEGFRAPVWTSPAQRCRAVAEAIGGDVRADARLLELDFGAWEGLRWDDVPRAALDAWAADPPGFAPPGGESGAELLARVRSFHIDLIAASADAIVVAHGGPLKLLAALLRGEAPDLLAPPPAMGSVTWLR